MRHSLDRWLRLFVVISLVLQGVIAAPASRADGDAHAAAANSVHCPMGSDCAGESGHSSPAKHCDASQGHTPAGLTGSYSTAAIDSASTPLATSTAFFSVHIPELPSRPPLAVSG